eukprot:g9083.t1 g9083   contig34:804769-805729(-)
MSRFFRSGSSNKNQQQTNNQSGAPSHSHPQQQSLSSPPAAAAGAHSQPPHAQHVQPNTQRGIQMAIASSSGHHQVGAIKSPVRRTRRVVPVTAPAPRGSSIPHKDPADTNAVPINLTEQRLLDWRNDAGVVGGGGIMGGATVGTVGGAGINRPNSNKGVTNLILLIEKSRNAAAPTCHHSSSRGETIGQITKDYQEQRWWWWRGEQQCADFQCRRKALHHACQKLRSVHTNIYSRRGGDDDNSGGICGDDSNSNGRITTSCH